MSVELRHLRYFQAVAEELSFSRASRRLRIAQPALSRAVQELERELGSVLLHRNRRSAQLTPAGAVLLAEVGLLLERFEESLRRVRRTALGEEGELRLGYIGPPTQAFLGRILREFRTRFPRVTVHLEERTPERVWEMVSRGRLSVGLTRPVLAHEALRLHSTVLRQERLCAAVPPQHPWAARNTVPWRMLKDESLILLARREGVSSHDAIMGACRESRFEPRIVQTPSLIGTVLRYVEAGTGIGVVPESVVWDETGRDVAGGSVCRLVPLTPAHKVALVMVWGDQGDEPAALSFRNLVQEWLEAGRLWSPSPTVARLRDPH